MTTPSSTGSYSQMIHFLSKLFRLDGYIRCNRAGVVMSVQTGAVKVGSKTYTVPGPTLVVPGQRVRQGQPLGRKRRHPKRLRKS